MSIINVEGAIYRADQWLLIRRSVQEEHAGGTLALVGGKLDAHEQGTDQLEEALYREVDEEVGIRIAPNPQYLYNSVFRTDAGQTVLNIVFLCEYAEGQAHSKSAAEVDDVYWMTSEQLLGDPSAPPWTKESIRRAEAARQQLLLNQSL
ncbi:NUDIX hydrolase [Paenibacillus bovis]|uniref:DNA mismatch repair protein MutT n=1 Tax=Paenibacillus bovis TaxID=1616788 RepID=A0A172ZGB2_9BACL|nr:NUDIX domain-containing protein [Paenibacillus bovis]ANF96691.1 DNA mismatch repair protein MutT [Paenibacillus bovis]